MSQKAPLAAVAKKQNTQRFHWGQFLFGESIKEEAVTAKKQAVDGLRLPLTPRPGIILTEGIIQIPFIEEKIHHYARKAWR